MKPWLVLLSMLSVALAGCADDGSAADGNEEMSDEPEGEVFQIDAPEWSVGDYWTYEGSNGLDYSLVVSDDGGSSYVIDTDSPDMAFFHDAFGPISYMGEIRKSDLAGSQDAGPVTWLDFPLVHNKEWQATWDGERFDMVSHVSENGYAHIIASLNGVAVNQLVYHDAIGWFESISFGDFETGEEFIRMDLTDSGTGFAGELIRIESVLAYEGEHTGSAADHNAQVDSSTASDDADAYLQYAASCTVGSYQFGIGTFNSIPDSAVNTGGESQGYDDFDAQCPVDNQFAGVIGENPNNGDQWGVIMQSESQDLHIVYQLYWRNYERFTL